MVLRSTKIFSILILLSALLLGGCNNKTPGGNPTKGGEGEFGSGTPISGIVALAAALNEQNEFVEPYLVQVVDPNAPRGVRGIAPVARLTFFLSNSPTALESQIEVTHLGVRDILGETVYLVQTTVGNVVQKFILQAPKGRTKPDALVKNACDNVYGTALVASVLGVYPPVFFARDFTGTVDVGVECSDGGPGSGSCSSIDPQLDYNYDLNYCQVNELYGISYPPKNVFF